MSALHATSWQTAKKVSCGPGPECAVCGTLVPQECAMCSKAVRCRNKGWRMEDRGGSVGPKRPLVEMMQNLRAMRWASCIWRSRVTLGKGLMGHFLFLLNI